MNKLQSYRDYLTRQGYRPEAHDDFVCFRHEGGTYLMPVEDRDPTYFRVIYPNFWTIDSDDERARANAAACDVTAALKGVKVFPLGNQISAAVELFLPSDDAWPALFGRVLHALQLAAHRFAAAMTASAPPADVLAMLDAMFKAKPPETGDAAKGSA